MMIRILILITMLMSAVALADNIYKFQDENGIWHFTDQLPDTEKDFETVFMEKEPEPRITMRREGTPTSPVYILFNDFWGPAEVEVRLVEAVNVLSEPPLPARFVIPGQTEQTLVGLGALDERRGFSYRLGLETIPGPPVAEPVKGMVIHPPYPSDKTFLISQGFNGMRTHNTPDSTYAVDISMPVGTRILAVRNGTVMDIEEDFNQGGTNRNKYADKANRVMILHEDGTMAIYAHLDLASVHVRPGSKVRAGKQIARSGNTGFSSGPHLHFAIQQNTGMNLISLPFSFQTPSGEPIAPVEKELFSGTLPGH